MFDSNHMPALVLTTLLLPAFGYLYMRFRDTRTLLWFLGLVWMLLDSDRLGWHDRMSRMYPRAY